MATRKQINAYAHRMEDKAEERLKEVGFKLVEDTGRRTQNLGDRIMYHEYTGILLMIDHKTRQNKESFNIPRKALEKIREEAQQYDPEALPGLTFNFKGGRDVYIIFNVKDLEGVIC